MLKARLFHAFARGDLAAVAVSLALIGCASTDETVAAEAINQSVVSARLAGDLEAAVAADPALATRLVIPAGLTIEHLTRFLRTNERAWLSVAARHGSVVSSPTSRPQR
jgi:hypothetical protein